MFSPQDLLQEIATEVKILKHLSTKIPEDKHQHRFSDAQRSIHELLEYLATNGAGFTIYMETENPEAVQAYKDKLGEITVGNFAEKIGQSYDVIAKYVADTTDWQKKFSFYGMFEQTKIWGLMFILKNLVAYRMQLFLQIKHAGNTDIGTMDNWAGESAKK